MQTYKVKTTAKIWKLFLAAFFLALVLVFAVFARQEADVIVWLAWLAAVGATVVFLYNAGNAFARSVTLYDDGRLVCRSLRGVARDLNVRDYHVEVITERYLPAVLFFIHADTKKTAERQKMVRVYIRDYKNAEDLIASVTGMPKNDGSF